MLYYIERETDMGFSIIKDGKAAIGINYPLTEKNITEFDCPNY